MTTDGSAGQGWPVAPPIHPASLRSASRQTRHGSATGQPWQASSVPVTQPLG